MTCLERESGQVIHVEEAAKILAEIFLRELPALQADNFEHLASNRTGSSEQDRNQP
jgi:hypothetical protein